MFTLNRRESAIGQPYYKPVTFSFFLVNNFSIVYVGVFCLPSWLYIEVLFDESKPDTDKISYETVNPWQSCHPWQNY